MVAKANALMKRNIDAMLTARGQTRRELGRWCLRTLDKRADVWMAKIMGDADREFPLKYWDRIADFFGVATYQLLQPGISPLTERRKADRRKMADRRISARNKQLPTTPIRKIEITPDDEALLEELRSLTHAEYQRVKHWVQVTRLGRGTGPVPEPPAAPAGTSAARGGKARRTRVVGET